MTLPVALLIACHKNETFLNDVRDILGENMSALETLSCRCKNHMGKLQLAEACCFSAERVSPISDDGSEIHHNRTGSTGRPSSASSASSADSRNSVVNSALLVKSYSYFSDCPAVPDCGECIAPPDFDAGKYLGLLIDLVENTSARFSRSYMFKEKEIKINYQNRDILDLGKNIQKPLPIQRPRQNQSFINNRVITIPKKCYDRGCNFVDIF